MVKSILEVGGGIHWSGPVGVRYQRQNLSERRAHVLAEMALCQHSGNQYPLLQSVE